MLLRNRPRKRITGKDLILQKIRDTLINLPHAYRNKRYTAPQLLGIINLINQSNIKDLALLILAFRNIKLYMYISERSNNVRYYSYGSCNSDFPEALAKEVSAEIPTGYVNTRRSGRIRKKIPIKRSLKEFFKVDKKIKSTITSNSTTETITESPTSDPENFPIVLCDQDLCHPVGSECNIDLPCDEVENVLTGYKLMDIHLDRDWTERVQDHTRKCKNSVLKVLKYNKRGYELAENFQCSICKEILVKRSSKEIEHNGKRGRSSVEINKAISLSLFTSAIPQSNMTQFCSEVGIIHPEYSTLQRNNKTLKRELMELSDEQLKKNRKEHVKFVRSQPGYEGDIEVFENGKDGKK